MATLVTSYTVTCFSFLFLSFLVVSQIVIVYSIKRKNKTAYCNVLNHACINHILGIQAKNSLQNSYLNAICFSWQTHIRSLFDLLHVSYQWITTYHSPYSDPLIHYYVIMTRYYIVRIINKRQRFLMIDLFQKYNKYSELKEYIHIHIPIIIYCIQYLFETNTSWWISKSKSAHAPKDERTK